MKNKWFSAGILGFWLIFGLFWTGCESPTSTQGKNYTVTYDANGAIGSVPAQQSYVDGTSITVAGQGNLSYYGYIFNGWNTNSNGYGTPYAAYDPLTVNSNITLYAQWVYSSSNYYTVTYDANGANGSVPGQQSTNAGDTITVAEQGNLSYYGYIFNGWNTNSNGYGTPYAPGSVLTVTSDITLYAQWVYSQGYTSTYTVTYNANGASGSVPTQEPVMEGIYFAVAGQGNLSYYGYIFTGWNTDSEGYGETYTAGSSMRVYEDTILYAQWVDSSSLSTVTYDANGAYGQAPASQTVAMGSYITVAGQENLYYPSYIFTGWNTNPYGYGTTYDAGSSLAVYGNTILYAQWEAGTGVAYSVTYNANGASGSVPEAQLYEVGSVITVAGQGNLTYTGRTFNGWNTNSNGNGTAYPAGSSLTVNANVTLYAQWITGQVVTYTVSFNSNGGSTVPSQTVNSGSVATRPSNPTQSGYTFVNWYSDSGLYTVYNFSDPVYDSITLYAMWYEQTPITLMVGFVPDAAPVITGPTIYHTDYIPTGGEDTPSSATVTVEDPTLYDSINWSIPGTSISESGEFITLDVGNTAYNAHGQHALTLEVIIKGVPYSRTITFMVEGTPAVTSSVTIQMYDSYGDGWNGAALRITINDTNLYPNATIGSGSYSNTYTFDVTTYDEVKIYWVSGSYNGECSFIVYYTDTPPSPTFTSSTTSWSGTGALVYRLRQTLNGVSTGTELGTFTAQ